MSKETWTVVLGSFCKPRLLNQPLDVNVSASCFCCIDLFVFFEGTVKAFAERDLCTKGGKNIDLKLSKVVLELLCFMRQDILALGCFNNANLCVKKGLDGRVIGIKAAQIVLHHWYIQAHTKCTPISLQMAGFWNML